MNPGDSLLAERCYLARLPAQPSPSCWKGFLGAEQGIKTQQVQGLCTWAHSVLSRGWGLGQIWTGQGRDPQGRGAEEGTHSPCSQGSVSQTVLLVTPALRMRRGATPQKGSPAMSLGKAHLLMVFLEWIGTLAYQRLWEGLQLGNMSKSAWKTYSQIVSEILLLRISFKTSLLESAFCKGFLRETGEAQPSPQMQKEELGPEQEKRRGSLQGRAWSWWVWAGGGADSRNWPEVPRLHFLSAREASLSSSAETFWAGSVAPVSMILEGVGHLLHPDL